MNNEDIKHQLVLRSKQQDCFIVDDVLAINHKPHPYTIGPKHIKYVNDNHRADLGEQECKEVQCAHPGCKYTYEKHTSDRVAALKLTRNASIEEANVAIQIIMIPEITGLDGIVLVDTPEKYRVTTNE
jgi:hypothetical protein